MTQSVFWAEAWIVSIALEACEEHICYGDALDSNKVYF